MAKERNAPRKIDKPQPDDVDRRRRFTWEEGDVRVIHSREKREATVPKELEGDKSLDGRAFDIAYGDGTVDERIRKLQEFIAAHPVADAEGARGYFEMFAMQKSALERTPTDTETAGGIEPFAELLSREITPGSRDRKQPDVNLLQAPLATTSKSVPLVYQAEVFNYLLANSQALGIAEVETFKALLMDGAVKLADGRRFAVEVKYRMGWLKACQAEWQFRGFLRMVEANEDLTPVDGGVVFFEEFTGVDWKESKGSSSTQPGWGHWYRGHADVGGLPLHLVRFRDQKLETYPPGPDSTK